MALLYSLQEISYTHSYLRVTVDKPAIEVSESKEYLDIIERL
jgi:hypothetical protein